MLCDLHLHSHHSDGEFAPARVVDMAADAGVELIALTDHDTTEGIVETLMRAAARGIAAVSGIEMTAYAHGRVVHVLGYGFDPSRPPLQQFNRVALDVWMANVRTWVLALIDGGFDLRAPEVLSEQHVRLPALIERLCARGVDDGDVGRCYARFKDFFAALPPEAYRRLPTPAEATEAIREAGGVAILAHPDRVGSDGLVETLLTDVDGIEAYYARYAPADREALRALAERNGKLYSCGSDYHGYFGGAYVNPRFEAPDALMVRLGLR
ncbi:MAG TPA: PHP domain-containing protein [Candidatus Eremiobacteraceae bacterium]|nr:PHP domain-containing protein [Candidatus Eremiobacteraceae bacterium]